jgi:hypothetical protein
MNRLVIGVAAALVGSALGARLETGPAFACSCAEVGDRAAFERSDAVFVGQVVGYRPPDLRDGVYRSTDAALWTFAVSQVYKGDVPASQAVVSEVSGASCGLEIPKRGEFLVFASRRGSNRGPTPGDGQLYAGLCGGTRSTSRRALPTDLGGPPTPPTPAVVPPARVAPSSARAPTEGAGQSGGIAVVWPVGSVLLVSILVALGMRAARRRRTRPTANPPGQVT